MEFQRYDKAKHSVFQCGTDRYMRMKDRLTNIPAWYKLVKMDWMLIVNKDAYENLERHYQKLKGNEHEQN